LRGNEGRQVTARRMPHQRDALDVDAQLIRLLRKGGEKGLDLFHHVLDARLGCQRIIDHRHADARLDVGRGDEADVALVPALPVTTVDEHQQRPLRPCGTIEIKRCSGPSP
jgi:hypothetical protein